MQLEKRLRIYYKVFIKDMVSICPALTANTNILPSFSKLTAKLLEKEHMVLPSSKFKAHLDQEEYMQYCLLQGKTDVKGLREEKTLRRIYQVWGEHEKPETQG